MFDRATEPVETDPVEKARAELKAALAAIEVKANVPRRVSLVIDDSVEKARTFSQRNPATSHSIFRPWPARLASTPVSTNSVKGPA